MIRFSALNQSHSREALSPREGGGQISRTKEAQESAALQKYNSALALQQSGKLEQAKISYGELLELPLVNEENDGDNTTGVRLKYLSLKNLAAISIASGCQEEALAYFVDAAAVDGSDVVLWYHMGRSALAQQRLALARHAFEVALSLHADYWPCVDSLCSVLFAIGDYHSCLDAVLDALELDGTYERGRALLQYMSQNESWLSKLKEEPMRAFTWLRQRLPADTVDQYVTEAVKLRPTVSKPDNSACKPELKLSSLSWSSLGCDLLSLWEKLTHQDSPSLLAVSVSLSDAIASVSSNDFRKAVAAPTSGVFSERQTAGTASDCADMEQLGRHSLKRKHPQASVSSINTSPQQTNSAQSNSPGTPKRRSTRNRATNKKENSDSPRCSEQLRAFLPVELRCQPVRTPVQLTPSPGGRQSQRMPSASALNVNRHHPFADHASGEEISDFLCRNVTNQGLLDLITKYLINMACNRRGVIWPVPLRKAFVQLYSLVRPCWSAPTLESRSEDSKRVNKLAWVALVGCELALDQFTTSALEASKKSSAPPSQPRLLSLIGRSIGADLHFLISTTTPVSFMGVEFVSRVYWLSAHVSTQLNQSAAAIGQFYKALHAVEYDDNPGREADDSHAKPLRVFSIKTAVHNPIISGGTIRQRIDTVTKQKTFDEIKENFSSGNHEKVIDTLEPLLDEDTFSANKDPQFDLIGNTAGPSERHRQLLLLQDAYFQLGRFQDCLRCAEINVSDILKSNDGMDEHLDLLNKILEVIPKCLKKPGTLFSNLPSLNQWRLANSLLQIIDHMSMNLETCQDTLPVALPWLVLHVLIKQISPSVSNTPNKLPLSKIANHAAQSKETTQPPTTGETQQQSDSATAESAVGTADKLPTDPTSETAPTPTACDEPMDASTDMTTPVISNMFSAASIGRIHTDSNSSASSTFSAAEHDPLPGHFRILQMAHAILGRHGLCCSMDGHLLLILVKEGKKLLPQLDSVTRDEVVRELEQCYFCLYGHPNKKYKARRLEDHGSPQIELTWTHSIDLFEFFCPVTQPTFDSTKIGLSTELLNLFRRIVTVLSRSLEPVVALESLQLYLEKAGHDHTVLPTTRTQQPVVSEIYHLLGDFHLKNADYLKSSKCYMQDLCYNPGRFDSWAGLALAKSQRIEERVNSLDTLGNTARFVRRQGQPTVLCYSQACRLNGDKCCLQEQFGLFAYGLSSLSSRYSQSQGDASVSGSGDDGGAAGVTLDRSMLLAQARECFVACLDLHGDEEDTWLHCLMLAKIAYKTGAALHESLNYCMKAQSYLDLKGVHANHYKRVSFANTTENLAALSSVEIFYRLHVIMLKALLKGDADAEQLDTIRTYLKKARMLPFAVANLTTASAAGLASTSQQPLPEVGSPPFSPSAASNVAATAQDSVNAHSCAPSASEEHTTEPTSTTAAAAAAVGAAIAPTCRIATRSRSGRSESHESSASSAETKEKDKDGDGSQHQDSVSSHDGDSQPEPSAQAGSKEDGACAADASAGRKRKRTLSSTSVDSKTCAAGSGNGTSAPCSTILEADDGEDTADSGADSSAAGLLRQCIGQLTLCARGFSRHYRTVYRLAHFYYSDPQKKNLERSRALLLHGSNSGGGGGSTDAWTAQLPQCSLFRLKAPFFQFWKSPIEELERPGSFVCHINRSLSLLQDVLVELSDTTHLLAVAQYLHKKPEQAKKFLHDTDRVGWANKMLKSCITLLGKQLRQEVQTLLDGIPAEDADAADASPKESYPSVESYAGLLECLGALFNVRSTAVKAKFDQTELDCLFVEAGQVLAPWIFAEKSAESIRAVSREELICSTIGFQQYYQSASAAASQTSQTATATAASSSLSIGLLSMDVTSQTVPDANSQMAAPSVATTGTGKADAASKTSASASSSGNCVASALRHMSVVQAARQTRPALLAIGVPRPAEATSTTEPAAELSPSAVSHVENGHTPVSNAAASVVTSPRSPTHPNPTPTQTSPQSNQHPLSSPPNSAPLDEPHVDEETMDEDP
ncbi:calcineurin-binding protein cabin-1-like isoform X1 [Sycon ciliatum]|uniref:calcineurin-binding protein cabin-1-like isoform X1 n=1 Tax=Sycon ciliatum TaxID=27933 RepID=UPI0031F69141